MIEHHQIEPSHCPNCGSLNEMATQIEPPFNGKPRPGDACACLKCGALAIYNRKMKLREPNKKERKQLERHPYMQRARSLIFQRRN